MRNVVALVAMIWLLSGCNKVSFFDNDEYEDISNYSGGQLSDLISLNETGKKEILDVLGKPDKMFYNSSDTEVWVYQEGGSMFNALGKEYKLNLLFDNNDKVKNYYFIEQN